MFISWVVIKEKKVFWKLNFWNFTLLRLGSLVLRMAIRAGGRFRPLFLISEWLMLSSKLSRDIASGNSFQWKYKSFATSLLIVLLIDFMLNYPPNITTDKLILYFLAEIRKFTVPTIIRNQRKRKLLMTSYFQEMTSHDLVLSVIILGTLQIFKAVALFKQES